MLTPPDLEDLEIIFNRGHFPSAADIPPLEFLGTSRRGSNVWIRARGKVEVARGLLELSTQNVGARIFAVDTQRVTFDGGLVGSRLPYAGFLRLQNAAFLYVSENTNAQVYIDESPVSGLTTSPTAGRLRVAIPDGGGGYSVFDAGFDKPILSSANLSVFTAGAGVLGQKAMAGQIGVAIAPWRTKTNAIGPPSEIVYSNIPPTGSTLIRIDPPAAVSGQDGWIYAGTKWGDQSGRIRVVRYVYLTPRGTFTATNGSTALTAGVGTFWTLDLRRGDILLVDGNSVEIADITSDTTATLTANFPGATSAGKTMTMDVMAANWYDDELGALVSHDVVRPPRAAGVLQHGGTVFLWGIPDTNSVASTSPTGNVIAAMLDGNPEHVGLLRIATASGADILNVLPGEGVLYLMTTLGLEVVTLKGDPDEPYLPKVAATPGFKAGTNGCMHDDYFYGFNGKPFRTRARENIDTAFAEPIQKITEAWNPDRVIVADDPKNDSVLYIHDDGAATVVVPWMAQLGHWGPEHNFGARFLDRAVVNNTLYITYLSGGNTRVQQWEGGAGIGGARYIASQFYDLRLLRKNRLKFLDFVGKAGTLSVFVATADQPVPDVSNLGAAAASFPLSDVAKVEPEIGTNLEGVAFALRVDFPSDDGKVDKVVARGRRKSR